MTDIQKLIPIDIEKCLEKSFVKTIEYSSENKVKYIIYQTNLEKKLFDKFDGLQIKIFSDKKEIKSEHMIHLTFFFDKTKPTTKDFEHIVNTVAYFKESIPSDTDFNDEYGGFWTDEDTKLIETKPWKRTKRWGGRSLVLTNHTFPSGLNIHYTPLGFSLTILEYHQLI